MADFYKIVETLKKICQNGKFGSVTSVKQGVFVVALSQQDPQNPHKLGVIKCPFILALHCGTTVQSCCNQIDCSMTALWCRNKVKFILTWNAVSCVEQSINRHRTTTHCWHEQTSKGPYYITFNLL